MPFVCRTNYHSSPCIDVSAKKNKKTGSQLRKGKKGKKKLNGNALLAPRPKYFLNDTASRDKLLHKNFRVKGTLAGRNSNKKQQQRQRQCGCRSKTPASSLIASSMWGRGGGGLYPVTDQKHLHENSVHTQPRTRTKNKTRQPTQWCCYYDGVCRLKAKAKRKTNK